MDSWQALSVLCMDAVFLISICLGSSLALALPCHAPALDPLPWTLFSPIKEILEHFARSVRHFVFFCVVVARIKV
ncbi:hypothetical protein BKA57DRAFT_468443, partial [Linnemannia elongata]